MSNGYVIQWKSKVNGRAGRGTKLFDKEEAELLADELNRDYPQIDHKAIPVRQSEETPTEETPSEQLDSSAASLFPVLHTV